MAEILTAHAVMRFAGSDVGPVVGVGVVRQAAEDVPERPGYPGLVHLQLPQGGRLDQLGQGQVGVPVGRRYRRCLRSVPERGIAGSALMILAGGRLGADEIADVSTDVTTPGTDPGCHA